MCTSSLRAVASILAVVERDFSLSGLEIDFSNGESSSWPCEVFLEGTLEGKSIVLLTSYM